MLVEEEKVSIKNYESAGEFSRYFKKFVNDLDLNELHTCPMENIIDEIEF